MELWSASLLGKTHIFFYFILAFYTTWVRVKGGNKQGACAGFIGSSTLLLLLKAFLQSGEEKVIGRLGRSCLATWTLPSYGNGTLFLFEKQLFFYCYSCTTCIAMHLSFATESDFKQFVNSSYILVFWKIIRWDVFRSINITIINMV